MNKRFVIATIIALVAASCGGGGDDSGADTTAGGSQSTTTTAGGSSGAGGNTDFCEFLEDIDDDTGQAFGSTSSQSIQMILDEVADNIDQAQDLAPSAVEADVEVVADVYQGLIDVFAENNYNLLAVASVAENDPRFLALDGAEFMTAIDNIGDFCGFPDFAAGPPSTVEPPTGGGTIDPGQVGDITTGELPDSFPDNLEPPSVLEIESITLAAGFSVNIFSDASFDDLVAFYTNELGDPTAILSSPEDSALWITGTLAVSILDEGDSRLVNVTQTG